MKEIRSFLYKIHFHIRGRLLSEAKKRGKEKEFYASYRHMKKNKIKKHNPDNFFAARPNPGAGVGHQIANWTAGYWYAKVFDLKFAHIPFCSSHIPNDVNQWEKYLNLGSDEITFAQLKKDGYKTVKLPIFNGESEEELNFIKEIIDSYGNQRIVFLAEQDQFYYRQYDIIPDLQRKYFAVHSKTEAYRYKEDSYNVAIHVRRGDIVQASGAKNPNLTMRFQENTYFVQALESALEFLSKSHQNIHIYLFSQGKEEDYPEFKKYTNFHFCLDMGAKESFTHMVFADALITSKSSFSYKPALFNQGLKFCPKNFWHGYPSDSNWIMLDDYGFIINGEL